MFNSSSGNLIPPIRRRPAPNPVPRTFVNSKGSDRTLKLYNVKWGIRSPSCQISKGDQLGAQKFAAENTVHGQVTRNQCIPSNTSHMKRASHDLERLKQPSQITVLECLLQRLLTFGASSRRRVGSTRAGRCAQECPRRTRPQGFSADMPHNRPVPCRSFARNPLPSLAGNVFTGLVSRNH